MFSNLIKKEVLENLITLRFALSCLLCLAALCLGTYVNLQEYRKDLADYHTNVSMHRHAIEQLRSGSDVRWGGIHVDLPINAMRIFASRTGGRGAEVLRVNQDDEPQPTESVRLNPVEWLFPRTDLTFFVGVIMSLLALVFSYDSISGEKERGTLRLMLSYSVPRDLVILGKWIGGYITLILPFTISFACALVMILTAAEVNLTADNWLQLGGMYLLSLGYLSAIFSLGLFISSRTSSSASSAVVALLVWVLIVLIAPTMSPYIAAEAAPAGTLSELGKQKREVIRSTWDHFEELQSKYDKENNLENWWEKGYDWNSPLILKRRLAMEENELQAIKDLAAQQEKANSAFLNRIDEQTHFGKYISRVSPFSSFMYTLLTCAGDDGSNDRQTRKLLMDYKARLADYSSVQTKDELNAKIAGKQPPSVNMSDIPKIQIPPASAGAITPELFIDVTLLLMWNVIFFLGAYLSFLKYDVR